MSTDSNRVAGPTIPERFLDVPSQRLYVLSLAALLQAIKLFDFFRFLVTDESQALYGRKWLIADLLFCLCLAWLRIPRLRYSKSVVALQIISLWLVDGLMFGGITVNLGGRNPLAGMSLTKLSAGRGAVTTTSTAGLLSYLPDVGLGILGSSKGDDGHLLGQHTVRMSPISTARLNPYGQTFCLASPGDSVLIPLLLNNTNAYSVQYSLVPLGYNEDSVEGEKNKVPQVERIELATKDMHVIEQSRQKALQSTRSASKRNPDDFDEYDDDDDEELPQAFRSPSLQKTQTLVHIQLNKPGRIVLERVVDISKVDARLVYPGEITVALCPRAEFTDSDVAVRGEDVRCALPGLRSGAGEELELELDVYGVPPLSLRWYKEVGGRRESFMVEGIENSGHAHGLSADDQRALVASGGRSPVELKIPLLVTLDALGTHTYVLESVTDALGNVVQTGLGLSTNKESKTRRSVTVVRRPSVSFQGCGPGVPAPLLIGSAAHLSVSGKDADPLDAPWDIAIRYQPPGPEERSSSKKLKAWTKSFQTPTDQKELTVRAEVPGEYTIMGVKGKYCEGDILSPETCKVVERPLPTADIEWKKIHECSGDIGVSASLVLHGTPPFHVYYRTQRDKESPVTQSKMFASSRGELTIQPDRSGHYVFQFVQISDANYKKVDLKGPSIDQVVHPPASADFVNSIHGGRGKKQINSCSGSLVDVDVELRGTGPWNLEVQIVGPKGSEIVRVPAITAAKKTLQLPIPKVVDRDGGSFEIDLVSVEDAYGCKRALSVPGIVVNVRRIQPTARFYGKDNERQITTLDNEQASLPLRLTGDGPWHVKYRRADAPDRILTTTVSNANGEIHVRDKGLYELLEIADSQCPGTVITSGVSYRVDHIPRPSAKLSSEIRSTYEPFNGSHILPPICEGVNDHVDLDLSGRPPFQIMYNVAKDNGMGGTKILDQPTFSSIQPRTSFQLHTDEAARIYYEVKQIGDAAYPLAKNKDAIIPRSQRLLFEQQILMRPSARFKNHNRMSYCLYDAFTPVDTFGQDGVVALEGTAPFQLKLSIRNLATSAIHYALVELQDTTWRLDIPSYTFHSIGPHLVTIESVQDASHCEQAVPDPLFRSIWVDIAETAAIVPFDRRQDFCVGEAIQFQLEGTPPWSIGYTINGKARTQEAKISPFSIVQQQAGDFTINSIAHQQKQCKTAITDLRYSVHSLPSAKVGEGKMVSSNIHEGDQVEIKFELIGEPPFTFTYQRSELTTKKGMLGKVLETHTVSGVTTREYSIFSALEGTWTVTFIADRYCRYPPAQPDGVLDKFR